MTVSYRRLVSAIASAGVLFVSSAAAAQTAGSAGLPAATPRADSAVLAGVVIDEEGRPLPAVDVQVPAIGRRARTDQLGRFLFVGVPEGTYDLIVRRVGYGARRQSLRTTALGRAIPEILLVSTTTSLAPIVASAERGGLYGVVADTGMRPVAGARVTIAGSSLNAITDSLGSFQVPLPSGSYLVYVDRSPYSRQLVGVTVPDDGGREIAIWMHDIPRPYAIVEAVQLFDLNQRILGASPASTKFFTRDALMAKGVETLDALARQWAGGGISAQCMVRMAGQPNWSRPLNTFRTEDIEFVEMYLSNAAGTQAPRGVTSLLGNPTTIMTETGRGQPATSADCGNLGMVVWPRS